MYTIKNYKADAATIYKFRSIKNFYALSQARRKKIEQQWNNIESRMNEYARKAFVGKFVKYNVTIFDVHNDPAKSITCLFYAKKVVNHTIIGDRITPYFNYGITAGKYYTKETNVPLDASWYVEEITKDEWKKEYAKVVTRKESDEIHFVWNIIGNEACSYVNNHLTERQIVLKSEIAKLEKQVSKLNKEDNEIFYDRKEKVKATVTEEEFNRVMNDGRTKGWYGLKCDYLFKQVRQAGRKKITKKKKK